MRTKPLPVAAEDLLADRKYVVKWCNGLRKSVGVGGTSRLTRGFHMTGMDPISRTLWGVGVRWTAVEGETVWLAGVGKDDAPSWPKLREHVERYRSFEDATVARFLRHFEAGLYPELLPKPPVAASSGA